MRFLFAFIVFCLFVSPATAQELCYTPAEAEAEQGIRIHSELMVIGLNCQHMGAREGMNLYGQYREFTATHGALFAGYEDTLMAFFKKRGDEKPVSALNALRTGFANDISTKAAGMRPDIFCGRFSPRIAQAYGMTQEEVRIWAGTIYPSHPVSYPVCEDLGSADVTDSE